MRTFILFQLLICFFGCKVDAPPQPEKPVEVSLRTDSTDAEADSLLPIIDQYILERSNPWIDFTPDYKPTESSQSLDYDFTIFVDNSLYGSFILSNIDSVAQNISFEITNNSPNIIKLFEVKQVRTNTGKIYSDPIIPVAAIVPLPKGESKLFIFQIKGKQVGRSNPTIAIDNGSQKKNIAIKTKIVMPSAILEDLNAVNWSYFEKPMLINREIEAGLDLYEHHINTSVVRFNEFPAIDATEFSGIVKYISYIKNVKNILIHQSPKYNKKTHPFLSDQWKKLFAVWYTNMLNTLSNAGYAKGSVYYYPYDEIKIDKYPELEALYTWAKGAIPDFKLYSTIITEETANKVVPLVDMVQLIHLHVPKLIETNYPKKGELWMYDTFGPTYALSPYDYYRLMAWIAYYRDIKGIGFWNYASFADKADNPINAIIEEMTPVRSYSIIYTGEGNEIISSRRWEAFSLGIEDYRILLLFEKRFGKEKTKAMAWNVISAKDKYDLAEQVRNEMINAL